MVADLSVGKAYVLLGGAYEYRSSSAEERA